jgi:hypothetical protein
MTPDPPPSMAGRTPSERSAPDEGPTGPRATLKKIGMPLLAYHVLILLGAFVVLSGLVVGPFGSEPFGLVLIGAGIALEIGILWWAVTLVRGAARTTSGRSEVALPTGPLRRWICPGCGRIGRELLATCPLCGRVRVRLPEGP